MTAFIGADLPPDVLYESDEDKNEATDDSSTTRKRKYEEVNIGPALPTKKQHIEEQETTKAKYDTIDDDEIDFYGPPLPPALNIKKDEPAQPTKINEVKKSEKKLLGPALPPPQLLEQVQKNALKEVIGPMPAGVLNPNMHYHVIDDDEDKSNEDQKKNVKSG